MSSTDRDQDEPAVQALREQVMGAAAAHGPSGEARAALLADLQRAVAAERGAGAWLRSRSTTVRTALALATLLAVVLATVVGWLRPDLSVYPAGRMAAIALFIAAGAALELLLALRPLSRPALRDWVAPLATLGALIGLAALYALPAAHLAHPASLHAPGLAELASRAVRCLAIGVPLALSFYALLRVLDRGGAERALSAAAYSGLCANLALQLHCPITAPAHMLFGHFGVALVVIGVALVQRLRAR